MTSFRYEAVDAKGRRKKGVVTADTLRRARKDIQTAGLTLLSIKSVREQTQGDGKKRVKNPSPKEVIEATRQLATLIDASTPVEEALASVGAQMKGSATGDVLLSIRGRIIEGWRLSDAFGEYPKAFSPLYRGVIAAGEASGNLGPIMLRLADMLEKNRAILMKAITSLIYPATIFLVATGVIIALMNLVVPKIVDQFSSRGTDLPLITQIVIGASNIVQDWWWVGLIAMIAFGVGVWQLRRRDGPRRVMDRWILKTPLIGGLARDLDAARFSRTLSTLFASGAPLLDSLQAARRTVTNAHVKHRLETTLTAVREGASLSTGIRRAEVFTPMMVAMIAAGERSGSLPTLLDKTAAQMEQAFDTIVTVALRLLEPAVLVILGGVVMSIILAIMLPILQINTMAL